MKKLFFPLLFIHISVFGQITITETNTIANLNQKIGFTLGLITSSMNLSTSPSLTGLSEYWVTIANEKLLPRIKLGLYGSINITEKSQFCLKIERFNNYLEYNIELGENYFEHLEEHPSVEAPYSSSTLPSSFKNSQILLSPSIRMELIDKLHLGLGLAFYSSFNHKLHINSEQIELWPRRNKMFNLVPNMYLNYNLKNNLLVEIDYLLLRPLNSLAGPDQMAGPHYVNYGQYELYLPGWSGDEDLKLFGASDGRLSFSLIYLL